MLFTSALAPGQSAGSRGPTGMCSGWVRPQSDSCAHAVVSAHQIPWGPSNVGDDSQAPTHVVQNLPLAMLGPSVCLPNPTIEAHLIPRPRGSEKTSPPAPFPQLFQGWTSPPRLASSSQSTRLYQSPKCEATHPHTKASDPSPCFCQGHLYLLSVARRSGWERAAFSL